MAMLKDCNISQIIWFIFEQTASSLRTYNKSITGDPQYDLFQIRQANWYSLYKIILEMAGLQQQCLEHDLSMKMECKTAKWSIQDCLKIIQKKFNKARPLLVKKPGKGTWSRSQQAAYILFLQSNAQTMEKKQMRKTKKIFIRMSRKIKTRTAQQCRSHHQKMMLNRQSLSQLINLYKKQAFPFSKCSKDTPCIEKDIKTIESNYTNDFEGLYRVTRHENAFKIQINTSKMISN